MRYLFDTNILLFYVRSGSVRDQIERKFDPFGEANECLLSVVSVGEIMVLADVHNWGKDKLAYL